jgi:hypothetical protein
VIFRDFLHKVAMKPFINLALPFTITIIIIITTANRQTRIFPLEDASIEAQLPTDPGRLNLPNHHGLTRSISNPHCTLHLIAVSFRCPRA